MCAVGNRNSIFTLQRWSGRVPFKQPKLFGEAALVAKGFCEVASAEAKEYRQRRVGEGWRGQIRSGDLRASRRVVLGVVFDEDDDQVRPHAG